MRNGHIKRITDADIQSSVLEVRALAVRRALCSSPAHFLDPPPPHAHAPKPPQLSTLSTHDSPKPSLAPRRLPPRQIMGTNVSTNYITCPADTKRTLGIKVGVPCLNAPPPIILPVSPPAPHRR